VWLLARAMSRGEIVARPLFRYKHQSVSFTLHVAVMSAPYCSNFSITASEPRVAAKCAGAASVCWVSHRSAPTSPDRSVPLDDRGTSRQKRAYNFVDACIRISANIKTPCEVNRHGQMGLGRSANNAEQPRLATAHSDPNSVLRGQVR
jgi:hypothetical protein